MHCTSAPNVFLSVPETNIAFVSSQRRSSVSSDGSSKSLRSVSFNDQVVFRSYQANNAIPLEREASIELLAGLDQPVKEISKLVPYKKSNSIKRAFKSIFKKSSSRSDNASPTAIVLG